LANRHPARQPLQHKRQPTGRRQCRPDFNLVTKDLADVSLKTYAGKKKLISIVPSSDTGVCAASTKIFKRALKGRGDVVALVVSADLPFAQGRFCGAEGSTTS